MGLSRRVRVVELAAALLLFPGCFRAQQPSPPAAGDGASAQAAYGVLGPMATLHVYTNLEQIPTLVLTRDRQRMKTFDPERLRVSLDEGPPFKPMHVRVEGNDPISLTVLVDTSNAHNELLSSVQEAVAGLAPEESQPPQASELADRDHVTFYAMDCALTRSADDLPANGGSMRFAMQQALEPMKARVAAKTAPCKPKLPLWDSMTAAGLRLRKLPGRRVMLVIAAEGDTGSKTSPLKLLEMLQESGIAVFVVRPPYLFTQSGAADRTNGLAALDARERNEIGDPLNTMAEATGGVLLTAEKKTLGVQLHRVVEMLRERYIVEYPRKNDEKAGVHRIKVIVPKSDAYVRSTGISVPIADPKELANPLTIPALSTSTAPAQEKVPQ